MQFKHTNNLTLKQKIAMVMRLVIKNHIPYKSNFLKYHLIRRKFIVSRASEFLGKNKFEPAPLLNQKILDAGCGLNGISDELSFRGADILAIDKDEKIIMAAEAVATKNGSPVKYEKTEFNDVKGKFNIILLLDFLTDRNL